MKKIAHPFSNISTLFFAVGTLVLTGTQVQAETTDWEDLGGGRARLVSIFDPVDGKVEGIVEVELKPGWSTYWRNPGEAGIPPLFDFSRSTGIKVASPSFPVPITKSAAGVVSVGYKHNVSFPFVGEPLSTPLSGKIKLEILLGVCEAVCIPATATFSLDMSSLNKSDPFSGSLIAAAKMKVPIKDATREGWPQIQGAERISDSVVRVHTKVPTSIKKPDLYIEGKDDWFFSPGKLVKREGEIALFDVNLSDLPKNADLAKTPLRLTLSNGDIGSEKTLIVGK